MTDNELIVEYMHLKSMRDSGSLYMVSQIVDQMLVIMEGMMERLPGKPMGAADLIRIANRENTVD
jgi:hypothetical protein